MNATTQDTQANAQVQSVYLTPTWVTPQNMAATVVKDGAVSASTLCVADLQSACSAAGIE
jgi:D-xylose transport system substrate-binding protein